MKKCVECGSEVSDSAVLCPICGGFTDKIDTEEADNIINKNIEDTTDTSSSSSDLLSDLDMAGFMYKEESEGTETKTESKSEPNTEATESKNITETVQEQEIVEDNKVEEVAETIEEKPVEKVAEQVEKQSDEKIEEKPVVTEDDKGQKNEGYNPYPDESEKKKSPMWLVILLIVILLAACTFAVIMIIKSFILTSDNSVQETVTEQVTISSEEDPNNSNDESQNDGAVIEDTSISDETVTEAETSSDPVVNIINENLSLGYDNISTEYDAESDTYKVLVTDAKFTQQILSIQNSTEADDEYNTLTDTITNESLAIKDKMSAIGVTSNLCVDYLNIADSETLVEVLNGNIDYSFIHKADIE